MLNKEVTRFLQRSRVSQNRASERETQLAGCGQNNKDPKYCPMIYNGNRTEWSPIRSVIIRVINKIGRPRSGSPICLITSMITDRIGRHEALLPINHNFNKICDIIGYFLNQNTRHSKLCFASSEKKSHLSAHVMARTVQLLRHDAYCPIKLSN